MNKSLDKKVFVGFTRSRLSAPGFTRPWDVCDSSFRFFFRPQWHISLPLHIPEILEVVKLLPFQVHIPEAWKALSGGAFPYWPLQGLSPEELQETGINHLCHIRWNVCRFLYLSPLNVDFEGVTSETNIRLTGGEQYMYLCEYVVYLVF